VASAGNMEKPPALFLESYFTVVQVTRDKGQAIICEQLGDRHPAVFRPARAAILAEAFRFTVPATAQQPRFVRACDLDRGLPRAH
jgi:hypothetical protein